MKKKIILKDGTPVTRTVISKSATKRNGIMQEMVVYHQQITKDKKISVTKHEAVKR